jgi:hypothetical protein
MYVCMHACMLVCVCVCVCVCVHTHARTRMYIHTYIHNIYGRGRHTHTRARAHTHTHAHTHTRHTQCSTPPPPHTHTLTLSLSLSHTHRGPTCAAHTYGLVDKTSTCGGGRAQQPSVPWRGDHSPQTSTAPYACARRSFFFLHKIAHYIHFKTYHTLSELTAPFACADPKSTFYVELLCKHIVSVQYRKYTI